MVVVLGCLKTISSVVGTGAKKNRPHHHSVDVVLDCLKTISRFVGIGVNNIDPISAAWAFILDYRKAIIRFDVGLENDFCEFRMRVIRF